MKNTKSLILYSFSLLFASLAILGAAFYFTEFLLIGFAAILAAVLLHNLSKPMKKIFHPYEFLCVPFAAAGIAAFIGIVIYLTVPTTVSQTKVLINQFSLAWEKSNAYLTYFQVPVNEIDWTQAFSYIDSVLVKAKNVFSTLFGACAGIFLIFILGIFLSMQPQLYIDSFLLLIPKSHTKLVAEIFEQTHAILQKWMLGQLASMTVVGVLTFIGLWLMQVPSAFILALLAGLLCFIPNFGPILSIFPALIISLAQSPWLMLYVIVWYSAVQLVESNFITPYIQQKAVLQPPALTMIFQILLALIAGALGLILAVPLLCTLSVWTRKIYIQNVLGK